MLRRSTRGLSSNEEILPFGCISESAEPTTADSPGTRPHRLSLKCHGSEYWQDTQPHLSDVPSPTGESFEMSQICSFSGDSGEGPDKGIPRVLAFQPKRLSLAEKQTSRTENQPRSVSNPEAQTPDPPTIPALYASHGSTSAFTMENAEARISDLRASKSSTTSNKENLDPREVWASYVGQKVADTSNTPQIEERKLAILAVALGKPAGQLLPPIEKPAPHDQSADLSFPESNFQLRTILDVVDEEIDDTSDGSSTVSGKTTASTACTVGDTSLDPNEVSIWDSEQTEAEISNNAMIVKKADKGKAREI